MTETIVDRIFGDYGSVVAALAENGDLSLLNSVEENYRKSLLLTAASYFEQRVVEHVVEYARERGGKDELIPRFIENKAAKRQFHTWFAWDSNNANAFFGLFGEDFRNYVTGYIKGVDGFDACISAFLEIGRERNRLVHQNYGAFALEKTAEELYVLYKSANDFVERIPQVLREGSEIIVADGANGGKEG
jgi:RiboL-PSP-HEPN